MKTRNSCVILKTNTRVNIISAKHMNIQLISNPTDNTVIS